jgi:biotin operon repressor
VSEHAPIRFPEDFNPFEDAPKDVRRETERILAESEARRRRVMGDASFSGTRPEDPEYRKSPDKPASLSQKVFQVPNRKAPGKVPELAGEADILEIFLGDLRRAGVVGEERLGKLVYLALTSRMLPWEPDRAVRPVSLLPKGTTSTGKSHVTRAALRFFPPSAYFDLGSFSRRYLFYTEEDFSHRFLVVPEWASIKEDEEIVAMLRVLLTEGRIVHGTVDAEGEGKGRRKAREIVKEGPTGLIITTTEAAIDAEMETRLFTVSTDDTPDQTRRVFHQIAGSQKGADALDLSRWHDIQDWIAAHGETRVYVPFATVLADLIPAGATRLRRDFGALLNLVRAHAILHQESRERDADGYLVATLEGDYAPVRDLVEGVIADGVEAGVSSAMRETVDAVSSLFEASGREYVSVRELDSRLGVGTSAIYDRVKRTLRAGYLVNKVGKGERGYKLALGGDLPGDDSFLPSPERVFQVLSGRRTGNANPHEQRGSDEFSGIRVFPVDPADIGVDQDEIERLAQLSIEAQAPEKDETGDEGTGAGR